MMRLSLILSLALLSQTSVAFQTAPAVKTYTITTIQSQAAVATCLRMISKHNNEFQEVDAAKKMLVVPLKPKCRGMLSKLTTFQLSALTQLKKDERNKFNKERLLKLGITMTAAFAAVFKKVPIAHAAATPLMVTRGAITPLLSMHSGLGLVEMPGMRGISPSQVGGLPNQGAMFFALALFVTSALLRSAGNGYVHLLHFMAKHLGNMIKDDNDEKEGIELGLPEETDWETYSRSMLDPLQKKKTTERNDYSFDARTNLFERINTKTEDNHEEEDVKLRKANESFLEQKYKQHHHPVHVSHSKYEQAAYLDTLAINEEEMHDMPKGYLDTLSDGKRSTWDEYKHQLDNAKPASEVTELKEEVSSLQSLMQIEQSMYQTSNQALKLAMEAQNEGLQRSSNNQDLTDFDQKLSTNEELKAFDKKSREYEKTVVKDAAKIAYAKDKKKTNWSI
mmetsp:Transcript_28595/g.60996  ORF Transcript_28595/g.60996 Transcript_28595/m.60996 type:complete len:450 (+) Transcript_28595:85-1434(+)